MYEVILYVKSFGNILYLLGVGLLGTTVFIPIMTAIFIGEAEATALGMLSFVTFWPGLILFFMGRELKKENAVISGNTTLSSQKSKKPLKAFLILILIILGLLVLANLPFYLL